MRSSSSTGKLDTSIRLRRGAEPRTVRVLIATRLEEPDRIAPVRVWGAFLAAAEVGLFGRAAVSGRTHEIQIRKGEGITADVLGATFAGIAARAFAALAEMVEASVPGVVRLEIHEQHRDERTLVVRGFSRDGEATLLDVDWEIAFAPDEASRFVVRFREAPPEDILERASRLVRVWAEAVSLGAFPHPEHRPSVAVLRQIAPGDMEELVADFEALGCVYDAFEALFQALDRLHEEHAIERVQVPCRVQGRRPDSRRAPPDRRAPVARFDLVKGNCQ